MVGMCERTWHMHAEYIGVMMALAILHNQSHRMAAPIIHSWGMVSGSPRAPCAETCHSGATNASAGGRVAAQVVADGRAPGLAGIRMSMVDHRDAYVARLCSVWYSCARRHHAAGMSGPRTQCVTRDVNCRLPAAACGSDCRPVMFGGIERLTAPSSGKGGNSTRQHAASCGSHRHQVQAHTINRCRRAAGCRVRS